MTDHETPLRHELRALGWSPEQLIARLNQVRHRRGALPLHAKSAYPWLRGNRPAPEPMADVLATLTEYTGRPITAATLGWSGPRQRRQRALDNPCDATADELLRDIQGETTMERRSFVLLSGAALTAPALDLLLRRSGPLHAAMDGDRVTPGLAANIESAVRQIRDLDDTEGSTSSVTLWADGLWKNLGRVITNSRYNSAEGLRIHTAFVELSETYGWMLFDSGKHPQAQRVYQTGIRLARETITGRPTDLAARNLMASIAYQASGLGQHKEAATLLSVARTTTTTNPLPPGLRAVIADREIYAAGHRGDVDHIRKARDEAHEQLQIADSGDDKPWWSIWLNPIAVDATTGRAWLASGDTNQAEPYLTQRLDVTGDSYPRDRVFATLDLADLYMLDNNSEMAASKAIDALENSTRIISPRIQSRLNDLTQSLLSYNSNPTVSEFIERSRNTVDTL